MPETPAGAPGPLSLLIVQPSPFCNINCDYCYLPDRQQRGTIRPETLEALFAAVFASRVVRERFSLIWHAGEPLVLPVAFYREADALLARYRPAHVKVRVCFQSNGMLIDDAWCRYFLESRAKLGISLDGPRDLHDRHRRTRRGQGTFDRAMAGVRRLQEAAVPFSVICVLTRDSLLQPERIFAFFAEAGIEDVGFNVEELEAAHTSSSIGFAESRDLFYGFMAAIMKLREGTAIRIREIDSFGSFLKHGRPVELSQQCRPFGIVSMDHRGNLATFSPELLGVETAQYGPMVFGNIHQISHLEGMLTNERFRAVYRDILAGVAACRDGCGYFTVCGGGAPGNKLFEHGSFAATETLYCRSKVQALTDLLLDHFG